jgi:hypothetical protein
MKQNVIAKGIQVITFLFGGFGFFLPQISPPDDGMALGSKTHGSSFAIGFCSFLTLIALLIISGAAAKPMRAKKINWLGVSATFGCVAMIIGLAYYSVLLRYTFDYPPWQPEYVYYSGLKMDPDAKSQMTLHRWSKADLVSNWGGRKGREHIWSESSRQAAQTLVLSFYIVFVLSICIAIFCAAEIISAGRAPRKPKAVQPSSLPNA